MNTSTGLMASYPFVDRVAQVLAGLWMASNHAASSVADHAGLLATTFLVHVVQSLRDRPLGMDRPTYDHLRFATIREIPRSRRLVAAPPRAAPPQPAGP